MTSQSMIPHQIPGSPTLDRLLDAVDDLSPTLGDSGAIRLVAEVADSLVDLEALIPGPLGELLERHDGDIVRAVARLLSEAARNPERRAFLDAFQGTKREARKAWRSRGALLPDRRHP
jgi:hypothetical protein